VLRKICFVSFLLPALTIYGQQLNYYFGNLHAHTAFSDGNKDSVSSGVYKPDGSYTYAKASSNFDFLGISEHNHYSSARNPGFKRPRYQEGLDMADAANEEGKFLSLFGLEYGVSSSYNGHVIIYGFNQLIGWETSAPGLTGYNYDVFNAKTDYDGLFTKVKNNQNSFCYLAHPNFDDFSTAGNEATALAYADYNSGYDSAIVGMPLRSGLATSPGDTYSDYPQGNYFNYYKKLLYLGYHLGIGYDHDNHYTNFGRGNGGRLVILAPGLTRANLFSAMKKMNFYGSDDANAKVHFEADGRIMGSVFSGSVYPTLKVIHNDEDGEDADTIKIWKGHRKSGGLWAEIIHMSLGNNTATYTDYDVQTDIEYYYFAEIRQKDGQWIMTSPVWYTPQPPVDVKGHNGLRVTLFPNPVSRSLSISTTSGLPVHFSLVSAGGQKVLERRFDSPSFVVDMNGIVKGIYFVEIRSGRFVKTDKVVVE
jgi:hypothetical protein